MSTHAPTVADPTHLEGLSKQSTRLMVYIEEDAGPRSQLVSLPDGVEVSVGRSRSCSVTVDSERISRRHLSITRNGDEIAVEDLGSRNGTRVNGELITARTVLAAGDEVTARPITIVLTTTGAVTWRRDLVDAGLFAERVASEVDRGLRYRRRFAVAMVRIEGSPDLVDSSIELLTTRARAMDVVAEYSDTEFAILFPELDAISADAELTRLAAAIDPSIVFRVGVAAYPVNGVQAGELLESARKALRTARRGPSRQAIRAQTDARTESPIPEDVIAVAPATRSLFLLIERVAGSTTTVLVIGETGSGKEIAARAIHDKSKRAGGPFVVINCACLPPNLLESELFGHEKGAFTGAEAQKIGFFEAASGGTMFLDEIGELGLELQPKLLRVLETHKIVRVGGTRELPVNVRVVCATNRDLAAEAEAGRFRSDLYYRIGGFTIAVPPLRDRVADIIPLANRFISEVASELDAPAPVLSDGARAALERFGWPGNIRELRNSVERATVLSTSGIIEVNDLPRVVTASLSAAPGPGGDANALDTVERAAIAAALEATGGNQTHAAMNLGLSRRALIYRMEKHGLKAKPS